MNTELYSPDCCWKCGKLGHHRQACSVNVHPAEENKIRMLCKRMEKEFIFENGQAPTFQNSISLSKFPICVLERSLNDSIEFYYEMMMEIQSVGKPLAMDVTAIRNQKVFHHEVNMKILNYRTTDKELAKYSKNQLKGEFISEFYKHDFELKVNQFEDLRRDVFNLSNKLTMWCWNAIGSANVFLKMNNEVKKWIDSSHYTLGRPTLEEIQKSKAGLDVNRKKLATMKRESKNLCNICKKSEANQVLKIIHQIETRLSAITNKIQKEELQIQVQVIEHKKKEVESDLEKKFGEKIKDLEKMLSCVLCVDNKKEWVLKCGHCYCTECVDGLESHRTVDSLPWHVENGPDIITQVPIPRECSFCRGTLVDKIKICYI